MSYRLITANRNYSSWSLRPWVLMKALGIDFTDEVRPFESEVNYAAFRAFSPTGQVPALIETLADGSERTVWDSLGIALYLADRHAGVWPADPDARAWAQCAAGGSKAGAAGTCTQRPTDTGAPWWPCAAAPSPANCQPW